MQTKIINNLTGEETIIDVPDESMESVEPTVPEPTIEERLQATESEVATIKEIVEVLYGQG